MAINTTDIKALREKTSAGVMDVRNALEASGGDMVKAEEWLKQKGLASAAKKSERETKAGLIDSYIHNGRVGVLLEVSCETDFVARTDDFKELCHDVALQIAAMDPQNVEELLEQDFIKNPGTNISDVVKGKIAKVGENIIIARFVRLELGAA
jgi:elongation factor Ts